MDSDIKSYLGNENAHEIIDYRNKILLSVVNQGTCNFVRTLYSLYNNAADLLNKRDIIRLLYEIISRTDSLFNTDDPLRLLTESLTVTALASINVENVQLMYDELLAQNISSLSQKSRLDFLWISHYVIEVYDILKIPHVDGFVDKLCDVITGEKDPRNLLVVFSLMAKVMSRVAKTNKDCESCAKLLAVYYPIQFTRPKNDRIGITASQLKLRLLECFKSNRNLGKYVIETLIDSSYSDFNGDDHLSVLEDTLFFIEECQLVYDSEHFAMHFKQFVDLIITELLLPLNDDYDEENGITDDGDLANVSKDGISMNDTGKAYYQEWVVDKKLKMYGILMRAFMKHLNSATDKVLSKLMNNLKTCLLTENLSDTNMDITSNAGYLLDVMCESEQITPSMFRYVIVPVILDIEKHLKLYKSNEVSEFTLNKMLTNTLRIMITLMAKLLSRMGDTKIPLDYSKIIINTSMNLLTFNTRNGLKLLTLGCISSITNPLVEETMAYCLDIISNRDNVTHDEVVIYLRAIIDVYRCHGSLVIDKFLEKTAIQLLESDVQQVLNELMNPNGVDITREVVELVNLSLKRSVNADFAILFASVSLKCISIIISDVDSASDGVLLMATCLNSVYQMNMNLKSITQLIGSNGGYLNGLVKIYNDLWLGREITQRVILMNRILPQLIATISKACNYNLPLDDSIMFLPLVLSDIDPEFVSYANKLLSMELDDQTLLRMESIGISIFKLAFTMLSDGRNVVVILEEFKRLNDYYYPFILLCILQYSTTELGRQDKNSTNFSLCTELFRKYLLDGAGNKMQYLNCLYTYDYKSVVQSITVLDLDVREFDVIGLVYNDLFFTYTPKPLNESEPLIKHQILYLRTLYKAKFLIDVDVTKTFITLMYNYLNERMETMDNSLGSIVESHLMILLPLLSLSNVEMLKFTECINKLLIGFTEIDIYGNNAYTSHYETWCRDQYVLCIQTLILRLFYDINKEDAKVFPFDFNANTLRGTYEENASKSTGLSVDNRLVLRKMVEISQVSLVPLCRVMGVLIISYIMEGQCLTREEESNVIKIMNKCLGDANKRVRTITLLCKQKWINNTN